MEKKKKKGRDQKRSESYNRRKNRILDALLPYGKLRDFKEETHWSSWLCYSRDNRNLASICGW